MCSRKVASRTCGYEVRKVAGRTLLISCRGVLWTFGFVCSPPAPTKTAGGPANVNLPPAQVAGEVAGERVSNPDNQGDWPAIARAKDGSLYAVRIEWNHKNARRVLGKRPDPHGRCGKEIPIEDGNWDHYSPTSIA